MTLSTQYPLLLLPLAAVIIIFYLFKQPSKEKVLSSLSLWESAYKQQHSQKPWEKFRHNILMYLQILIVLLLIAALCAPVIKGSKKTEQVMFVFDTSASMQTLYSENTTRLEQAKKEARKILQASDHTLEVTIISCDNEAKLVLNNSQHTQTIFDALEQIKATDCAGTLDASIPLCESIYSQWEQGSCYFFTDSSLNTKKLPANIYDFSAGSADITENLRLTMEDVVKNEENNTVTINVAVTNYGTSSAAGDVSFFINDTLLDVKDFEIEKDQSVRLQSKHITIRQDMEFPLRIRAELHTQDALTADNAAYHVFYENYASNRILLATQKNSFLESALASFTGVWQENIYKITSIEDYHPNDSYDLYIFDGMFPKTLPTDGAVWLFPDTTHMKASSTSFQSLLSELSCKDIQKTQYINLADSSVSSNLDNISFPVSKTLSMEMPADAESIFQLDQGASCGYLQRIHGYALVVFGFDLHDTDFPLQTSFPIFMYNLLTQSLSQHNFSYDTYERDIVAGDTITYYPTDAGKKVSIVNQNGSEIQAFTPATTLSSTITIQQAGIYDFYVKEDNRHAYLAVNFPSYAQPDESNLTLVPTFTASKQADTTQKQAGQSAAIPVFPVLLFFALLLLLLEFFLWIKQQWNRIHRPFFTAMRTMLVLLLCLSIADIPIISSKGTETTLFLADVSDSMKRNFSDLEAALQQAARDLPKGSQAGIIAFGSDSRVEHFLSKHLQFSHLETAPVTSSTNLESAVQTAISMFGEDDSKRLILLTDGKENEGTVKNMASSLKEHNITLKVMEFSQDTQEEVLISNVRLPDTLSVGEAFQTEVTVMSNVNTNATLSLYSGDTLKGIKKVSLTKGINRFLFQDTLTKSGTTEYRAIIEPEQDTEVLNNEYLTFTQAQQPQKLLLIEGKENEAAAFEKILDAGGISYKTISPFAAPRKLSALKQYSVILTENVHADDLPSGFKQILESYVKEGGGFIAAGGDNSFALGNYQNTTLETVLPVSSILNGDDEVPETAMALVIDHSGSMGTGTQQINRLNLAKEAAISALTSLRPTDSIGILAFDDSFDWVVDFTKASDTETIAQQISSIAVNGGTSIYPALKEAVSVLAKQSAKLKHIILLTDGGDEFRAYNQLYQTIQEENITLSTVAVSNGADTTLLKSMAQAGGGRYYYTDLSTDIPRIFAQEVFLSSESYLVNQTFQPKILSSAITSVTEPLLQETIPSLYGYIRTSLKTTSFVSSLITSDTNDPILAVQPFGLGTTAAFTSDITNEWTKDFAGRSTYASFWKNLIKYCTQQTTPETSAKLSVASEENTAHISYSTDTSYDDKTTELYAICTDEDGNSATVPFTQETSHAWTADIPLTHTGIYHLTVTAAYENSQTQVSSCTFASTYSKEYEFYDDSSTLDALISLTDAQRIESAAEFYTGSLPKTTTKQSLTPLFLFLTLLLFMIDVAMRRFGIPSYLLPKSKPAQQKQRTMPPAAPINNTASLQDAPVPEESKTRTKQRKKRERHQKKHQNF